MTQHHDPDTFAELDARARAAASGLREHVLERLDVDAPLAEVSAPRRPGRRPLAAVAAIVVLVIGGLVVTDRDDGRSQVEVDIDESLPEPAPGELRLLGPRDGKDSIQLPVTVEPSTGLRDGDVVTASGTGFEPGERVGIVLCAREAGGATPEERGGVDGCDVGSVVYADADATGVASGEIVVRRILTTPLTGTVDCAAEAERCMVAMGALSDYDRSGGLGIAFAPAGDPIEIPTVRVAPSAGLSDGDIVHVSGSGFTPNSVLDVQVCSADPAACWQTGEELRVQFREDGIWAVGVGDDPPGQTDAYWGLQVDAAGNVDGDVPVWQFLPGAEPGTYVDCAVSRCSLRISGQTAPPTVPLGFEPGARPPAPPAVAVEPTEGLAPGDEVLVRGSGFQPGGLFYVMLCEGPAGSPDPRHSCTSTGEGERRVGEEGAFALEFEIPDLGTSEGWPTTTMCTADGCGDVPTQSPEDVRCDGVATECAIVVEWLGDGMRAGVGPPTWSPAPVPVTFR